MKIQTLKLACFSPTGTSLSILEAIKQGMHIEKTEIINATRSDQRKQSLLAASNDLLVIAMPVYSGRLPVVAEQWLQQMSLDNTPTVCVVVYGNREYDDALLELKNIVQQRGGVPVAGATFIGEHSFSTDSTPIAVSRPDSTDLEQARTFGEKIQSIIDSFDAVPVEKKLNVPGNLPYKAIGKGGALDFIDISAACTLCGQCASVCPVDAITISDSVTMDLENCIHCCACIKACPVHARTMKEGALMDAAKRLSTMCNEPKKPTFFFA
jgi:ferredoxin